MTAPQPGKINFAGMVGAKRRRMRSGGNVSTLPGPVANNNNNNNPAKNDPDMSLDSDEEKTAQTSKCKGATTIPIFLKSKLSPLTDIMGTPLCSEKGTKTSFQSKAPSSLKATLSMQFYEF